jgi:hypothetical protein
MEVQPLYSRGKNDGAHLTGGRVGAREGLDVSEKRQNLLPLPRFGLRTFQHVA